MTPVSLTISGPPSVQRRLIQSCNYFQKPHIKLPIHGPFHAPHLHSTKDVRNILTNETQEIFGRSTLHFPLISSVSAKQFPASTPLQLIEQCLAEILLEPLRWDKVLDESVGDLLKLESDSCTVHAIGPTNLTNSFVTFLKTAGVLQVSVEDESTWTSAHTSSVPSRAKSESNIAIVGMAGRFPNAADHELFWELLEKGLDVHREIPQDRFDVKTHCDPNGKIRNTTHTPYGCFVDNPGLFDPRFFNMSPREAAQTDPMARLELTTAYEAMEMAGIVPGRTPSTKHDRIGTFYGQTSDDWREINAAQDIDTYFISGGVRAFGSGRINYHFKFSGPSFTVDTACSSSFAAIQLACTSLRAGECDTAFTGGANIMTNSDIFSGLSRGHFLSKTGSCKTFDNDADGYCRGDGVATVILKRMEDALADKDPILGVIRGTATNHSAEAVSITHPHVGAQQFLFSKVCQESGIDPRDVSYVEMHGTGTQAGDGVEMESVSSVFAPVRQMRNADQPLYLGSVKSNVGHGEGVSGVTALIKVLLMLQKNMIPPHCGIKGVINKGFPKDLKERNVNIALKKTPYPRPEGGKRTVFINNFSAAGGNTAMLLEDGPAKAPLTVSDPRSTHVVTVSAKSLASFKNNIKRLQSYLEGTVGIDLASLAYTSTARRLHYNYRAAFAVSDIKQVRTALASLEGKIHTPVVSTPPAIAFVFTGQGSQYAALGDQLYRTSSHFRSTLQAYDQIAVSQGFQSFLGLIDGTVADIKQMSPVAVQLGMTCVQMAVARMWTAWGVEPSVVIGHSLGEYAALNVAGVLSVADTIYLVGVRAQLLEKHCTRGTHAMLAIKASKSMISNIVEENNVEVACINSANETVLSGTAGEIDLVANKLTLQGLRSTKLNVPFAFHSSQVDPILESFETIASSVTFHEPSIPVISSLRATVTGHEELPMEIGSKPNAFSALYLSEHCRKPVDFLGGLNAGIGAGVIDENTIWVEIGAHPVCSGMIKSSFNASTMTVPSLRREESPWKTLANSTCALYLAGVSIDWSVYHQGFESSLEHLVLPTYGFDEKVYWLQYTGDWNLAKGTIPAKPESTKLVEHVPNLSTSIHKIIKEEWKGNTAAVVAESDLNEPLFHAAVSGHLCNSVGLFPSSMYGDMALQITDYAYRLLRPVSQKLDMNVSSMENPASLILNDNERPEHQIVQTEVELDLALHQAIVKITTLASNGKTRTLHAQCVVKFEDALQWTSDWDRIAFLIQTRIDILKEKVNVGKANRLTSAMAYKLFASFVQYSDKYRGMREVLVDSANLEATAEVVFQAGPKDGGYFLSPYVTDAIGHLAGFIMNGGDESHDSKNYVWVSHGWDTMRVAREISVGKRYRSYVRMQSVPGKGTVVSGDVYTFDDEGRIIAVFGGLRFQRIPRTVINIVLPPRGAGTSQLPHRSVTRPMTTKKAIEAPPKSIVAQKTSVAVEAVKKVGTPTGELATKALNICAMEIGVDSSEFADAIQFTDLGVDSLMSLTISGRFREELSLEVPNTLFTDFPTVGALKSYLSKQGPEEVVDESTDSSDKPGEDIAMPTLTPDSSASSSVGLRTPQVDGEDEEGLITVIRSTIANEMGIDIEEIADTTDLSTIGMDSLMSLTILGTLREQTSLQLDPTLLADNPSIRDIKKALGLTKKNITPSLAPQMPKLKEKLVEAAKMLPPATSVLLQGNTRTATKKLFFLPDGSGSATSYISIPPIAPADLCVYGLNCPFMTDPASFTVAIGVEGVSRQYLQEILRRQPEGPYLLGGWSAGGVMAYECTRQLAAMAAANPGKNYEVETLILIDSPCPINLDPLPATLHIFFNNIGLLGTGTGVVPSWLLPHFASSIAALSAYQPTRLDTRTKDPKVLFIWARDGVCKYPTDPRPPHQEDEPNSMTWLLENRTDFAFNGWDQLLGQNGTCTAIEGNHFTMMKEPIVSV